MPALSALNTRIAIKLGRLPVGHSKTKNLKSMVLIYPSFHLPCYISQLAQLIKSRLYYVKKLSTKLRCTEGMQAVNIGLYNEMKPLKSVWPKM